MRVPLQWLREYCDPTIGTAELASLLTLHGVKTERFFRYGVPEREHYVVGRVLEAVAHRYPAKHYVMVDDKVRILAAMKQSWGSKLTTIFPRQGHYARDTAEVAKYPAPDVTLESIGALAERDLSALAG